MTFDVRQWMKDHPGSWHACPRCGNWNDGGKVDPCAQCPANVRVKKERLNYVPDRKKTHGPGVWVCAEHEAMVAVGSAIEQTRGPSKGGWCTPGAHRVAAGRPAVKYYVKETQ